MIILILLLTFGAVVYLHYHKKNTREIDKQFYADELKEIAQTIRVKKVGPKMAVIEADKLLDLALKDLNVSGENAAERLKNASRSNMLKSPDNAWTVHKVRNKLVHEKHINVDIKRAQNVVRAIENELHHLGVI